MNWQYKPRNYSLRTAIGGLIVAACIIAALWWLMFN